MTMGHPLNAARGRGFCSHFVGGGGGGTNGRARFGEYYYAVFLCSSFVIVDNKGAVFRDQPMNINAIFGIRTNCKTNVKSSVRE
jgi:hypothetical protein